MIRSLRRRFIFSAMAAFGILLAVLVGGIAVSSYYRVESAADMILETALRGVELRAAEPNPEQGRGMSFGYRLAQPQGRIGHYTISVNPDGEIVGIEEKGIWEPDYDAARDYARQILASGGESGKIASYKYRLERQQDGGARMVLLDNSIQIHMLADLLRTAGLLGLGCMALLFLILLPISARVVRSYALNIEKQKQFITNAGHEIKTPVAIIMSNVDAMELIQGENKWSRNIRSQTERLSALLQRMLFMARIDEGSVILPAEDVDLARLTRAELECYGERIAERGLCMKIELPGELPMRGSRDYLQQLIHMLMDNAVQYVSEGGEISLRMEKRRRMARIVISNSVESLPDCPGEALFDRFYRGDSARTQSGGGYGIGLSAARAICEMHRGRISAQYEGDHRISFIAELPLKA